MSSQRKKPGPKPMQHPTAKLNYRIDARIFQWIADRGRRAGTHHVQASLLMWIAATAEQRERVIKECQKLQQFNGPIEDFATSAARAVSVAEVRDAVPAVDPKDASPAPAKRHRPRTKAGA